jgi:phospholipid transport system substrate-binding protein
MPKSFLLRLAMAGAAGAAIGAPLAVPAVVQAQALEPAAQQIETFDAALIRAMKQGKAGADAEARAKTLTPAVEAAFDIPVMTSFAVGPTWASASAEDKAALIAAFRKFTIASYAKNFSSYDGQKIAVDPMVQTRLPDKLVRTTMTGGDSSVALAYRMRQSGGTWKVIDVLYNGAISQLTTQRSDFAATLANGGVKALVAKLNAQTDKLLKG